MGKSIKILIFMSILTKLSFAQVVPSLTGTNGIFCHRGGNGKFSLDMSRRIINIESLFSKRKRQKMFESEQVKDQQMLDLEGASLEFETILASNGYVNIKAHDSYSRTFINMNIENIEKLLNEEKSRVSGEITVFTLDDETRSMFLEYSSPVRCELD